MHLILKDIDIPFIHLFQCFNFSFLYVTIFSEQTIFFISWKTMIIDTHLYLVYFYLMCPCFYLLFFLGIFCIFYFYFFFSICLLLFFLLFIVVILFSPISAEIPSIQGLALNLRNFDFFPRLFFKKMVELQCFFFQTSSWKKHEKAKPIRMFQKKTLNFNLVFEK